MRRLVSLIGILSTVLVTVPACLSQDVAEDGEFDSFPNGKADGGIDEGSAEALGVLALVNDPDMTPEALKAAAHITIRAAGNIVDHRDGPDATPGTSDDDKFDTLRELDDIPWVGPASLHALLEAARDRGLVATGAKIDVIFSPQPSAMSHTARIAQMIGDAHHTIDIAMYSYSNGDIATALQDAVGRGVQVRFLFDTAKTDKSITDPAKRAASKSGRIEGDGIDVRYVNKILHHKFIIIDGPRDDASAAATAQIVTGSANWSNSGATVFDENTLFIRDSEETAASYQAEFDALWNGSRDFTGPAPAQAGSPLRILPSDVPDEAGLEVLFTRANMTAGGSDGTTWKTDKDSLAVASKFVEAIQHAQTSIHVASGHMRSRPIAEALIAAKQAHPDLDIEVYVDQQEWISTFTDDKQKQRVADCEANATTPAKKRDCGYNDFLFSKELVDAGIDVRFKAYAYRWNFVYAAQMHSKYMIVDGKELISGSYNLSMNSEHNTMENAMHLSGVQFAPVLAKYEANFASIFETGRDLLPGLEDDVANASTIPLVFPSMALTWAEFDQLRRDIRSNCADADTDEFRNNPASHKFCTR